jgi:hypothetical protein
MLYHRAFSESKPFYADTMLGFLRHLKTDDAFQGHTAKVHFKFICI